MTDATGISANVESVVPFLWVHDIQASLRFYVDGLGFHKTHEWVDEGRLRWCWLVLGGSALMLQEFWREGQHRNVPEESVGVGVSLTFFCKDAIAIYHEIRARGIDAKRPFVGNGLWTVGVADPDGYNLFFESPADAAEESELPESNPGAYG
jgi:catechol 2,3-dioxygenase-like lactoylglutathione lyase family enzyme